MLIENVLCSSRSSDSKQNVRIFACTRAELFRVLTCTTDDAPEMSPTLSRPSAIASTVNLSTVMFLFVIFIRSSLREVLSPCTSRVTMR